MNALINYVVRPYYVGSNRQPTFVGFMGLLGIYLLTAFFLGFLQVVVCHLFGIVRKALDLSLIDRLILVVLMAPVYEEILFRSLLKIRRINALIFVLVLSGLILFSFIHSKTAYVIAFSVVLTAFFCVLVLLKEAQVKSFVEKYFAYLFYISALSFGLLHSNNFTGETWKLITFSFVLGGPQILLGIILGYVRVNYGLFYSILFHAIINSAVIFVHGG